MRTLFYIIILSLVVCLLFTLFPGCSKREKNISFPENTAFDSLILSYKQQLQVDPVAVRQEVLSQLDNLPDSISYYRLLQVLNTCYIYETEIDSAFKINKAIIHFAETTREDAPVIPELGAIACHTNSQFLSNAGKRDSALLYLQQGLNILYQTKYKEPKRYIPVLYLTMGDTYRNSGNYPQSVNSCRKALLAADSLKVNESVYFSIYSTLARTYLELKNYPLSDQYFRLLEENIESMDLYDKYSFCNSRGFYYYETKEYEKALPWYRKSNIYAKELGILDVEAPIWANMGEIFLYLNQPDSSKYYLDKASRFFFEPNADPSSAFYLNMLYASLYLQTGNLKEAGSILDKHYGAVIGNPNYKYINDRRLEEFYEKKGDFRNAYKYRKDADVYDDSLRNITTRNNIAEMDFRYSQDTTILKQDVLITQQKQEVQQFRNTTLILILLIAIIFLGIIVAVIYMRRKKEQEYAGQMAVVTKLRMDNIRNRISPHFILNVLNSIIPGLEQHKELNLPLNLLIQSVREGLLVSEKIAIPLEEEIGIVKNYVRLRQNINPETIDVQWNISPRVNQNTLLPSMIIQIPVENAIKYAFNAGQQEKKISVKMVEKDDYLSIVIEDNGIGFNSGRYSGSQQGTGQGIKILYKTVELLNSRNQHKIKFEIRDLSHISPGFNGTRVIIELPLTYVFDL